MSNEIPVVEYGQPEKGKFKNAWWELKKDELPMHLFSKVTAIQENQSSRRRDWLRFARLYTNTEFDHFMQGVSMSAFGKRLSFNVCRSCVDTASAKISKAKPRPLFLTENGNFSQQSRAKKLTQYTDGMFYDLKMYQLGKKAFKDGCVFGTGVTKYYIENGAVKAERVFIDEIVLDDLVDGKNETPREMYQAKMVHKEVLIGLYPEHKKEIEEATFKWSNITSKTITTEMLAVVEAWHLPSSDTAKDGRHVISIDRLVLLDEPYEKNYFPFTFFKWNPPLLGFYGEGLISQLIGIQLEINQILLRIKEAQELVAIPRVYIEEGSSIAGQTMNDEIGGMYKYRGSPPIFQTPTGMNREVYDYLEYLYRKAFEDTGISQLSATSKKPAGLDSRVALREFQDIETERFALVAESYQQLYLDASKILIDLQRELEEDGKKPTVKIKGADFIETVRWKDVDLSDDKFIMQAYPSNFLPKTPEGQLEFTQELVQSGYIEPEEALSLLNFPDLKGFFNLKTAAIDDIKFMLEGIIERGEYTPPEPYMNLNLAIKMTQASYLRSKTDGTPEDRQELLRRMIDECQYLLGALTTPQEPSPPTDVMGMQGIPGAIAEPMSAPVSDLMPIQGSPLPPVVPLPQQPIVPQGGQIV